MANYQNSCGLGDVDAVINVYVRSVFAFNPKDYASIEGLD